MDLMVSILYWMIIFFGMCFLAEMIYRSMAGSKPVNKIDRIRELRVKTGLSLLECKRMVDAETGKDYTLH